MQITTPNTSLTSHQINQSIALVHRFNGLQRNQCLGVFHQLLKTQAIQQTVLIPHLVTAGYEVDLILSVTKSDNH